MTEGIACVSGLTCRQRRYATLVPTTSCIEAVDDFCAPRVRAGLSLDLPARNRLSSSHVPRAELAHQRGRRRAPNLLACASQAGYAEPHMGINPGPAAQSHGHRGPPGAVWTAIVLVCATFMALAGAFTAFILYMRPVLKRMESAAQATETASKAMEQSAKEFEQTSLLLQADSPSMIAEIEAAAQEYHQLGQTLNIMTAGFRGKNPVKDWSALSMKRVAKDVSALTNALSPAMDQWRKRISRIATSFEVAHKAELKTAEKDALDSKAKQGSAIGGHEESADGSLQAVQDTGKQLASAAVSIRQGIGGGNSTGGNSTDGKPGRRHTRDDAVSTQKALDLLDANEAQTGADAINAAADAAEKVTTQVTQLVADLAQGSHDSDAVADAYQQSVSSQDLPGMSEEEQALLTQLATKKKAAEQVYRALQRAEQAATAAATASGALEQAMQVAESQGVLSSSDEVYVSNNSSSIKYRKEEDRTAKGKSQGKRRQENLPQAKTGVETGISAVQVDSSSRDSPAGPDSV